MTTEKNSDKVDCGGRSSLPLCKNFLGHSVTPPLVNAFTNFAKKLKANKAKRKRQANWDATSGFRKVRAKTN